MENVQAIPQVTLEKTAIFIDYHNLEGALRNENLKVDLISLRGSLAAGRFLLETFVFIGFNPKNFEEDEKFHRFLKMHGFLVCTKSAKIKPDGTLKCDLDMEMALAVIDYVMQARPDLAILITGDGDFSALATWLRMRGVRVEVASTLNSLSQDLKEAANECIELAEAIEGIREGA
jgi:uncharacterized LabA/DUF88 family protein